MVLVFLEGLLALSNNYKKTKIFEIVDSREIERNVHAPFSLKNFLSYTNNPVKFSAQTKLWATFYVTIFFICKKK